MCEMSEQQPELSDVDKVCCCFDRSMKRQIFVVVVVVIRIFR